VTNINCGSVGQRHATRHDSMDGPAIPANVNCGWVGQRRAARAAVDERLVATGELRLGGEVAAPTVCISSTRAAPRAFVGS
jgi:hypothetical protein